ncbi:MAG: pyridoxamine 5'-phosphate oxidase family protein [Rhizobiaceae bacterium]
MHIEELTKAASLQFLAERRFGRLACVSGAQPYVTPFNFACHDHYIYSFSPAGQKIEWLRANPLVCVEADEIVNPWKWTSVIVFGRYEELVKGGETEASRVLAHKLLQQRDLWWEPGYAKPIQPRATRPFEPVYFRLSIDQISGRRGVQE